MEFSQDSVFNQRYPFESDVVDLKKYFKEFGDLLKPFEKCTEENCGDEGVNHDCKDDEFYAGFLEISKEELKELKERTSVDHLTCEGEIKPVSHDFHKRFDEDLIKPKNKVQTTLISVKNQEEFLDAKLKHQRTFFKYCNYQWCLNNEKPNKIGLDFDTEDFSSVVVCVKVYCPFMSSRSKGLKIKLLEEIHLLGNQTLAELRDKIICCLDYVGDKDESNDCYLKDVGYNITAKDEYPSSFIFIENTFYNDTRSGELVDLSEEIREWGSKRGLGPFEISSMEKTVLCSLSVRIGRPYVFQHQGNCEHLIVFSDIRFLDLSDPPKGKAYPRIHSTGRMYGKHCMMCSDSYAKWLVVGNERLTHDKTYLCGKCFFSYNYVNGRKVGEFRAYKYVDPVALL